MNPAARILAVLLAASSIAVAGLASAQAGVSLQELAIDWVRGNYGSPLLCQIDGKPLRGMRRLQVTPGRRYSSQKLARILFVEMEVENATRCFTDLEASVPNITGSLQLRFPGFERRDTSRRELKAILKREGGLEFEIAKGVLRLQPIGDPPEARQDVDFSGGKARFLSVGPGSDAERMLSDIKSPRKLHLLIVSPDGTKISLPIFVTDAR